MNPEQLFYLCDKLERIADALETLASTVQPAFTLRTPTAGGGSKLERCPPFVATGRPMVEPA